MPLELGVWRIDEELTQIEVTSLDQEQRLEDLLDADITIVSPNWMVIGRQVLTDYGGFIDLLTVDPTGRLAVLELKRDKTPREVVAQLLDYASWVRHLDDDGIARIFDAYLQKYHPDQKATSIDEAFRKRFNLPSLPDSLNTGHDLVVVASALDASTERIVTYLADEYGVRINAIFLRVFRDDAREYLTRAWLIDPTEVEVSGEGSRPEDWNGEYYVSFGNDDRRNWDDAILYGFTSAGGGSWYSRTLQQLSPGDRIWVNVPGYGYAGVGRIVETAVRVDDFVVRQNGMAKPIGEMPFNARDMLKDHDDSEKSEYLVRVEWIKTVPLQEAVKEKGFFGNQNTVCKPLAKSWRHTVDRLKKRFHVA